MVSPSDVRALFEARLKEGIPNPPGQFHPLDLERVKDDKYLNRIIVHMENDAKAAADMLWDILVWRKSFGANDINESTVRMDYVKEGAFFPQGRDIDGHLMLVIKSKMHVKGQKDLEEIKKVVVYWFDRIERQENGRPITLFFDMDGCGLSNMDMELIKYLISLMKLYYPCFLHFIFIFQMPWVLSAAFKVVKTLLPAKAVELMKFVSKDNIKDFVPLDQALVCWGGTNTYEFEFVPEGKNQESSTKKVTFAEQGDNQHSPGEMLQLSPSDAIMFNVENDDISGQFVITNMDESAVSFKIRTTSPEKFRVRPSSGVLNPGSSITVTITVQPGFHIRTISKDRFLVMSIQIPNTEVSQAELTDIWQKSNLTKDEYRLKCHFPETKPPKNGNTVDYELEAKYDSVTNALNDLQVNYESINKQVKVMKMFQLLTLLMTAAGLFLGYLMYSKRADEGYCSSI